MAVEFSSSGLLVYGTAWLQTVPFTVGMWARPAGTGAQKYMWSQVDTVAATGGRFGITQEASDVWGIEAFDGTTEEIATAGTVTANQWSYLVARFISASNRRLAVLDSNGARSHALGTTSLTPSGVDNMILGATQDTGSFSGHFDGRISKLWICNADIQADGAQLDNAMLHQLAFGGPLSVPHIHKNLLFYQGLRLGNAPMGQVNGLEAYITTRTISPSTSGTIAMAADPPLPYWHVEPRQRKSLLTI